MPTASIPGTGTLCRTLRIPGIPGIRECHIILGMAFRRVETDVLLIFEAYNLNFIYKKMAIKKTGCLCRHRMPIAPEILSIKIVNKVNIHEKCHFYRF